jgi:hypothetical protein
LSYLRVSGCLLRFDLLTYDSHVVTADRYLLLPTRPTEHAALYEGAALALRHLRFGAGVRPQPVERLDGELGDFRGLERDCQRHPTLARKDHVEPARLYAQFARKTGLRATRAFQPLQDDEFRSHDERAYSQYENCVKGFRSQKEKFLSHLGNSLMWLKLMLHYRMMQE